MIIRPEISNDIKAIEALTLAAFTGVFSDNPTEHLIVNGLRDAGALSRSLVADVDETATDLNETTTTTTTR